jgi:hypothetical protein
MEKFGIDNMLIVVALPVEMGNIADEIGHDNASGFKKWFKITSMLPELIDLLKVKWSDIPGELTDLSDVEKSQIEEFVKQKLELQDKNLEGTIEESLSIVSELATLVQRCVTLSQKIKALKNS